MAESSQDGPAEEGIDFDRARGPSGVRVYAVGDIHGRADLLERMISTIRAEIDRDRPADWRIVFLGDYVDRGPDSSMVLERIAGLAGRDPRYIALAGNHDVGMVEFLESPDASSLFIQYGGVETARSYGVEFDPNDPVELRQGHRALLRAVPPTHLAVLRGAVFSVTFGDFFYCHAGIRPGVPLARQAPDDLVWMRRPFLDDARLHPKIVVHGHTIVGRAEIHPNRVNVDTGAWRSGVLTALMVDGSEKRLVAARDRP